MQEYALFAPASAVVENVWRKGRAIVVCCVAHDVMGFNRFKKAGRQMYSEKPWL
jgi:hypothetical protein